MSYRYIQTQYEFKYRRKKQKTKNWLNLLVVAGAVGVDPQLVSYDPSRLRLPLKSGHPDSQDPRTDETLEDQGEPVILPLKDRHKYTWSHSYVCLSS